MKTATLKWPQWTSYHCKRWRPYQEKGNLTLVLLSSFRNCNHVLSQSNFEYANITLDNIHTTKHTKEKFFHRFSSHGKVEKEKCHFYKTTKEHILYISSIIKTDRNFSTLSNAAKTQPECQVIEREREKARSCVEFDLHKSSKKHHGLILGAFFDILLEPRFIWSPCCH